MHFSVVSQKEAPDVRYEKVGRLIFGPDGMIEVIRDEHGVIGTFRREDALLVLNELPVPSLRLSESGNRVMISGTDGREYVVLSRQLRVMIRDWGKKKAALFRVE